MGKQLCGCPCGHERFGLRVADRNLIWRASVERHMLQKPQGWAIQKAVIDFHFNAGDVAEVRIITDAQTYTASMIQFMAKSVVIDRGYGEQRALPLA